MPDTANTLPAPTGAAGTIAGPQLADFEAARITVGRVVRTTPVESSRHIAEVLGAPVFLKCENLQRTGSYKLRGAYNRLSSLSDEERARGVVAASAGNHAQGVALAARELGIRATIFMPIGVALPKLEATRDYGADVVLRGNVIGETLDAAAAYAAESGSVLIPPFDHPDVVAGQGTLGLEILEQVPDVDTVIVPIGGGGLASGVASAIRQQSLATGRTVRIIGVQAANAAPYPASLAAGEPVSIPVIPTIADGIAVYRPGNLNFEIIRDTVDEIVTVTEDDVARAIIVLMERAKLVVEPAGAVSVAAILSGVVKSDGPTVAILSGGNIDPLLMQRVISHGLAASDRYLTISIMLPDRPGQLARTAELVAAANANVVEVLHTRHGAGREISDVELQLSIETRGPAHKDFVVETLRAAGYDPRIV
ncbi:MULTISPECIES: threonine ammonia-lyase [unclassified Leifsonia]|uniref:threonine ammonia-lyase n=1 Tax=unclassified Leifsonia TaxID=2663824 RepID=UPI0006FF7B90|nr:MULTISPECIES: threonine ammonia-lyase [unclassified Leifsonia]KQX07461.1 threonine dehydratase [Leifsonia sp. Root1293]KRA11743.1 threonine dehydratase [Leifsonia sp. Root60]